MVKKKKITAEKFSTFTALLLISVFLSIFIGGNIRIILTNLDLLPMTNLFGEAGLVKEVGKKTYLYNEGDIFRPFFGIFFIILTSIVFNVFINFFKKNFIYSIMHDLSFFKKDSFYLKSWLLILFVPAIAFTIIVMIIQFSIHLVNINFDKSIPHDHIIAFASIWFLYLFISFIIDYVKK